MSDWRKVDWLPSYEVSADGQVRRVASGQGARVGTILKPTYCSRGYARLGLFEGGKRRNVKIHRLVCEAFHGSPPFPAAQAAHWDGDQRNNHFTNLRWATVAENAADNVRLGVLASGEQSPSAKLTWGDVLHIRSTYTGKFGEIARIAKRYGVARSAISNIIHGVTWRENRKPVGEPA